MALIDVVRWEGTPDIFAWKFPENNLTTLTQLIVNESQEAVLFHKGKLLSKFGPGKHTLSTENIPLLENLFGIPFGGKNPFTAEVWFVNKVHNLNIKWGTRQPFQLLDPEFKVMVPVRANGQFGLKIKDSESFLVKLVGTLPQFDTYNLTEYFRGLLLTKTTALIAKTIRNDKVSILDVASHIDTISTNLQEGLQPYFDEYGIGLVNFFVNSISVPEEDSSVQHLKSLLSQKAEMDMLKYNYQQKRSFDVLDTAAQNEGSSGGTMGVGMGLGMGFGAGKSFGKMMNGMGNFMDEQTVNCSKCNFSNVVNSKFCAGCGQSMFDAKDKTDVQEIKCDKCNHAIPSGSKFCPNCGDAYNSCTKCNADIPQNAIACPACGEKVPKECPECKTVISGSSKFCPSCGTSLIEVCGKCNNEINPDSSFCGSCGEKII